MVLSFVLFFPFTPNADTPYNATTGKYCEKSSTVTLLSICSATSFLTPELNPFIWPLSNPIIP